MSDDQGAVDAIGEPMGAIDGSGPMSVPAAVTMNVWTMPSATCGGAIARAGSGDAVGSSGSAVIPCGTKQSAIYSPAWAMAMSPSAVAPSGANSWPTTVTSASASSLGSANSSSKLLVTPPFLRARISSWSSAP